MANKLKSPAIFIPYDFDVPMSQTIEQLQEVCTEQTKAINELIDEVNTLRARLDRLDKK